MNNDVLILFKFLSKAVALFCFFDRLVTNSITGLDPIMTKHGCITILITLALLTGCTQLHPPFEEEITAKLKDVIALGDPSTQGKISSEIISDYGSQALPALEKLMRSKDREIRLYAYYIALRISNNKRTINKAMKDPYYQIRVIGLVSSSFINEKYHKYYQRHLRQKGLDDAIYNEIIEEIKTYNIQSLHLFWSGAGLDLEGRYLAIWSDQLLSKFITIIKNPEEDELFRMNLVRIIARNFGPRMEGRLESDYKSIIRNRQRYSPAFIQLISDRLTIMKSLDIYR